MIRICITIALLSLCFTGAAAQKSPASTLPKEPKPSTTSVIRGRVIYADTGRPLRRAQIVLLAQDSGTVSGNAVTDRSGEFVFSGVGAGKYLVVANAPDIVNPFEQYGKGSLMLSVVLGQIEDGYSEVTVDGRSSVKTEIRASRGGVITGRVMTETDEPIAKALIKLFRVESNGRLIPATVTERIRNEEKWMFETDSRGIYRISGLSTGEYIVRASESDEGGNPDDAAEGSYTDGSMMAAFYPKALRIQDATPVAVQQGSETRDVDIRVTDRPGHRLSGTVVVKGQPVSGAELELLRDEPETERFRFLNGRVRTDVDGSWELRSIPDGKYTLSISGWVANINRMGIRELVQLAPLRREIVVAGGDLTNLKVEVVEGAIVRGLVSVEGGAKSPDGINIELISAEAALKPGTKESQSGESADQVMANAYIKETGSFLIAPIDSGSFRFRVSNLKNKHYVKSISLNGKDLVRNPLQVDPEKVVDGVRIVLATDLVSLSGRAVEKDDKSKPLSDAVVLLLPVETERRRLTEEPIAARTDKDGRFVVKGAPGEYFVVVLDRRRKDIPAALPTEASLIKNSTTLQKVSLQRADEKKVVEVLGPSQP